MNLSSRSFDFGVLGITCLSELTNIIPAQGFGRSILQGLKYGSLAMVVDRVMRALIAENVNKVEGSLEERVVSPLVEEGLYSGILATQSLAWSIPRFFAASLTSMTAARALMQEENSSQVIKSKLTLDTKIGFVFAAVREVMLLTMTPAYSIPISVAADSIVFGLSEVCSSKKVKAPEKWSRNWSYKLLTSIFFRLTANTASQREGLLAATVQHLVFNFSRTLS